MAIDLSQILSEIRNMTSSKWRQGWGQNLWAINEGRMPGVEESACLRRAEPVWSPPRGRGGGLAGVDSFYKVSHKQGPLPSSVHGDRSWRVEAGGSITLVNGEGDACTVLCLPSESSPPGPVSGSATTTCHRRDLVNVHTNDENPGVENQCYKPQIRKH